MLSSKTSHTCCRPLNLRKVSIPFPLDESMISSLLHGVQDKLQHHLRARLATHLLTLRPAICEALVHQVESIRSVRVRDGTIVNGVSHGGLVHSECLRFREWHYFEFVARVGGCLVWRGRELLESLDGVFAYQKLAYDVSVVVLLILRERGLFQRVGARRGQRRCIRRRLVVLPESRPFRRLKARLLDR